VTPWASRRCLQLLAYIAFVVSIVWIYLTADELVASIQVGDRDAGPPGRQARSRTHSVAPITGALGAPQVIGAVFNIDESILGITVLAWGNSVGGTPRPCALESVPWRWLI